MNQFKKTPIWLWISSFFITACFATPIVYIVVRNISEGSNAVETLFSSHTLSPLLNTLYLAISVTFATAILGTLLAWIIVRTDLPYARFWRVAVALPLVLPSFLAGIALLDAFRPGGIVPEILEPLGLGMPPVIDGFWGSFTALTLVTYPYVFLPVSARLSSLSTEQDEAARVLGKGSWSIFPRIIWPQIASSTQAGALLVLLYVVSDFGLVRVMDYITLSTRIFTNRLFDGPLSFSLGLILAILALVIAALESRAGGKSKQHLESGKKIPRKIALRWWRVPALLTVITPLLFGLGAPIFVFCWWTFNTTTNNWSERLGDLGTPLLNTFWISIVVAILTVALMLPIAYLSTRYRSRGTNYIQTIVASSFAIPGLLIALSTVFMTLEVPGLEVLYLTFIPLIFSYIVHFGVQALRNTEIGVLTLDSQLTETAQALGAKRLRRLLKIEVPLMTPTLLAGAGIVLLSVMKELPVTLLASPIGFQTLATRIWGLEAEGFLAETGLTALVLILLSTLLTWFLVLRTESKRS
tara:strand:+ start:2242 stop:3819 length:1578 start_codon:yes stop_codon:yes gene_type:complete